jgi:hypothetical protein
MKKPTKTIKKSKTLGEVKPKFSITLRIGNDTYHGEGETALEALQAIPKPAKMMNKGTFVMTDGVKKTNPVLMYPLRLRRLFYGKLAQAVQLKSLCLAMK